MARNIGADWTTYAPAGTGQGILHRWFAARAAAKPARRPGAGRMSATHARMQDDDSATEFDYTWTTADERAGSTIPILARRPTMTTGGDHEKTRSSEGGSSFSGAVIRIGRDRHARCRSGGSGRVRPGGRHAIGLHPGHQLADGGTSRSGVSRRALRRRAGGCLALGAAAIHRQLRYGGEPHSGGHSGDLLP